MRRLIQKTLALMTAFSMAFCLGTVALAGDNSGEEEEVSPILYTISDWTDEAQSYPEFGAIETADAASETVDSSSTDDDLAGAADDAESNAETTGTETGTDEAETTAGGDAWTAGTDTETNDLQSPDDAESSAEDGQWKVLTVYLPTDSYYGGFSYITLRLSLSGSEDSAVTETIDQTSLATNETVKRDGVSYHQLDYRVYLAESGETESADYVVTAEGQDMAGGTVELPVQEDKTTNGLRTLIIILSVIVVVLIVGIIVAVIIIRRKRPGEESAYTYGGGDRGRSNVRPVVHGAELRVVYYKEGESPEQGQWNCFAVGKTPKKLKDMAGRYNGQRLDRLPEQLGDIKLSVSSDGKAVQVDCGQGEKFTLDDKQYVADWPKDGPDKLRLIWFPQGR